MRTLVLSIILLFSCNSFSQWGQQYFDGDDTIVGQAIFIQIDSMSRDLWQIGQPQKTLFYSASTDPNVIITDTAYALPESADDYFWFGVDPQPFFQGLVAIEWIQKLDLDTNNEVGFIEYSIDTMNTWTNVFGDPNVYNFYGFNSQNQGFHSLTGTQGFVGQDTLWKNIWLCFDGSSWNGLDSVYFRYRVVSDSIPHNSEGWMIDNFQVHETWFHTIIENSLDLAFVAFPTVTNGPIQVVCKRTSNLPQLEAVELIDISGRVVEQFFPQSLDFKLDLSPYPDGQYVLKIITDQGFDVCRVNVTR